MKALIKHGPGADNVQLVEMEEPQCKDNEIKIKVHAAGICGTDLHIIKDEYPCKFPVVMGHEYSGTVIDTGAKVDRFRVGDRVVSLTAVVTCGKCRYCREGLLMLCGERKSIGSGVNGAFAQYLTVPADLAFSIPDNISLEEAVLCEPLACIVRCVIERGSVKAGDHVLVSGPGTIGLLTLQVAKASGGNVVVVGTSKDQARLALAKELGARETVAIDTDGAEKRIWELTENQGFDVAFECSGVAASADQCLRLLKKTGLYVQVGLFGKKIEFDFDLALMKEIRITNGFASEPTSWERALKLLENGQLNVKPLISTKLPLKEWKRAFAMVENKEAFKVLLDPSC